MDAPSPAPQQTQPGYHGAIINPVANELMSDMSNSKLSPEEALQMMNDFVSGNQDMNKSIKNMQGMLNQVATFIRPHGLSGA